MTTNFDGGVTNVGGNMPWGNATGLYPYTAIRYQNDFTSYAAADFTATVTGTSSAALSAAPGAGGWLRLSTSAGATDAIFMQKTGEAFLFTAGKSSRFTAKFRVSDANTSSIVVGLQVTDTTPLAVSDGVYFIKTTGATTVDVVVVKASVATTVSAITSLVNATDIELAFVFDGVLANGVKYYVNNIAIGTIAATNLPNVQTLTPSFGIQNGAGAIKTLDIDFIAAEQDR